MLSGSLDAFALPDVVRLLAGREITGRIEVVREEITGELWMDRGRIRASRLADEEAPSNVDEAIDVAVVLFDGTAGEFNVQPEEWVGGPLDLDPDGLIAAVDKRREEWASVIASLGSLEDPLLLASDLPEGTEEIIITADQWRSITLVDGTRSVQDIARDSATTVYRTALSMAELAALGLVTRGAGVKWDGVSPAPTDDPIEVLRELGTSRHAMGGDSAAGEADAEAVLAEALADGELHPLRDDEDDAPKEGGRERRLLRRK